MHATAAFVVALHKNLSALTRICCTQYAWDDCSDLRLITFDAHIA